jgi:fluoride exporter
MYHVFLVGLGGCIGSILRYGLAGLTHRWTDSEFPFGTLAVNLVGCLLAGAVWSIVEHRTWLNPDVRIFLTVGILGGFTTFSAFSHETFVLLRDGRHAWALVNMTASVLLGLGGVFLGWMAVKALSA